MRIQEKQIKAANAQTKQTIICLPVKHQKT